MAEMLIVDDEKNILEALNILFKDQHKITLCSTGSETLDVINKKNFDIVLLDQYLGDMRGNEILKVIKERNDNTSVVMISGYKTKELVFEAGKFGADEYVVKPFDKDELLNIIEHLTQKNMPNTKELQGKPADVIYESNDMESAKEYIFSNEEISIMKLLCEGKSNRETSLLLNKKESFVKNALHIIFIKLRVKNRVEAVNKIKDILKI
ncbi:MAG: hypothetical protein A2452_13055 [Candidatus Firestonebacteria bacterium RIFOXYC2_FULL_39_67]|nr:MAG: hypothetical protein A2536_04355 [Candidatus Firestonebacteria bacterium RIFOXYD2_FULL_39_29]OGF55038.1 MAG: hypothetical protein A2452_13055 [Candidatus Firestonebacteria bacterium RIFOXYC2_FULL_39_67]OGF58017.1 MAG: hypothetical protein A2497_07800 [Candidatus Firestonebacteria bacterium RifOxyC12_full_39_7]